jgi:hypothetical protein
LASYHLKIDFVIVLSRFSMKQLLYTKKDSERGQVLVIIALAMIGLIAMTGLAIDGSMALADRRNAQNAADTAVLAGALAKVKPQTDGDGNVIPWKIVALDRAGSNGYTGDIIRSQVEVYSCDEDDANCESPYTGSADHVKVVIISHLNTTFARVISIQQLDNRVEAISVARLGMVGELYNGASVVGLAPNQCKTIWFSGSSELEISGGGVFSNSSLNCGLTVQGSSDNTLHDGAIEMVASTYTVNGKPEMSIAGGIHGGAVQYPYPPPAYMLPNPTCAGPAVKSGSTMSPGSWSGEFPPKGVNTLNAGTYCVNGEFKVNAKDKLTGSGVTIFMQSGGVTWNGGAEIKLSAPASGDLAGLLIYAPMSNSSTMRFNGNGSSVLTGTIFTPAADIVYNGTSNVVESNVQIIGYTVELTGSNGTLIQYLDGDNWDSNQPPQVGISQ